MKLAVIDTGVFVAGVFWRHEPHLCLRAWLRGILTPVMSEEILAEYDAVLARVKQEQQFTTDASPWINTMRTAAMWVEPIPFQGVVCRDPRDNKFLEAALAAQECHTIIARDQDLTVLEKPFGIGIYTPRQWLRHADATAKKTTAWLNGASRRRPEVCMAGRLRHQIGLQSAPLVGTPFRMVQVSWRTSSMRRI